MIRKSRGIFSDSPTTGRMIAVYLLVLMFAISGCGNDPPPTHRVPFDNESLVNAAQNGAAAQVDSLLQAGINPNSQNELGETALAWAAVRGDETIVQRLLEAGADPDLTNVLGVGPLALALESGLEDIARLLLEGGADPNLSRENGETALMTAIRLQLPKTVQLLLSAGADPNASEAQFRQTPLMWAAGQPNVVRMLIEAGASSDSITETWEVTAANYTPIIQTLGVTGIPWNHDGLYSMPAGGESALHFAVRRKDIESVELLLDAGMDIDLRSADGTTPLLASLYNWHASGPSGRAYTFAPDIEIANLLLERGADASAADRAGYTPLHGAALSLLLSDPQGSSRMAFNSMLGNLPDRPHPTPQEGGEEVIALVKRLLDAGADPNQPNYLKTPGPVNYVRINPCPPGSTAYHVAAAARSSELATLLATHGADPNLVREDGHTPFSLAVMNNDLPVVKVMVEHGADIQKRYDPDDELADPVLSETQRRKQQSILHIAGVHGSDWVVDYLVSKGAPLDSINDLGETPLELADAQERYRVAKENEGFQGKPLSDNLERETQTTDALKTALRERRDAARRTRPPLATSNLQAAPNGS